MHPPRVRVVNERELIELLDEFFSEGHEPTTEEMDDRFKRVCRVAYSVTRSALDGDEPSMHELIGSALEKMMESHGINAATGALIMEAVGVFIDARWTEDRKRFKTQFIQALDNAVENAYNKLEESNESRTEQSASQRPAEPNTTP